MITEAVEIGVMSRISTVNAEAENKGQDISPEPLSENSTANSLRN